MNCPFNQFQPCQKKQCALYGGMCSIRAIADVMKSAEQEAGSLVTSLDNLEDTFSKILAFAEDRLDDMKNKYVPGSSRYPY